MQATRPVASLAAIPGVTARLAAILGALAALVARAFLNNPRHVACIVPLYTYIRRTACRFDRVMARLAAGHRPSGATTASRPAHRRATPRPPRLYPTNRFWLVTALRHEAAGYGSQLNHLLNEPETAALIAAAPQAARLLRPLCRMLGIAPAALQAPPRRPPAAAAPRPAPRPRPPAAPRHDPPDDIGAISPPPGAWPRPICERLLERWPWTWIAASHPVATG